MNISQWDACYHKNDSQPRGGRRSSLCFAAAPRYRYTARGNEQKDVFKSRKDRKLVEGIEKVKDLLKI